MIIRQTDPGTGSKRTIIMGEGSSRAFGKSTVLSMAGKDESEVAEWLDGMTHLHLRGLVHEVTERVVEESQQYHQRKAELANSRQHVNYAYFGLPADASEKDLDLVFRRLARQMHPDKNGGTDEAKARFQNMRTRYDQLRQQIALLARSGSGVEQQQQQPSSEQGSSQKPANNRDGSDGKAAA